VRKQEQEELLDQLTCRDIIDEHKDSLQEDELEEEDDDDVLEDVPDGASSKGEREDEEAQSTLDYYLISRIAQNGRHSTFSKNSQTKPTDL
jgi:hypothetical protein